MAVSLLPDVNKANAFHGGFLDSKYAQRVVDRCNIWANMLVQSPVGVSLGNWVVSESNAILVLNLPSSGYPWIESDALASSYAAILGAGVADFANGTASPIKNFEIEVADPANANASKMSLVVGSDSGAGNNDHLQFGINGTIPLLLQWAAGGSVTVSGNAGTTSMSGNTILLVGAGSDRTAIQTPTGAGSITLVPITISGTTFYAFQ